MLPMKLVFISSPEPKARLAIAIVFRPSSVVRKLFTFSSSSPEPVDRFQPNLVGIILWGYGPKVVHGEHVAPRGAQGEGPKGKKGGKL